MQPPPFCYRIFNYEAGACRASSAEEVPGGVTTYGAVSNAATAELVAAAQRCRARHAPDTAWPPANVGRLGDLVATVDEAFCREVADRFERLPRLLYDSALARRYDDLKRETLLQYETILDAGIAVEPWLRPGQPYRDAADLVGGVRRTGTIYVFLTRNGHGPSRSLGFHPMREPSGVTAKGVELSHNDLFRVVHDVFGHVMAGNGFGPTGEFKAAYCHMSLLSESARPVLFTEQVAQTCWFFFGPHLRDDAGRVRRPGEPGHVPPRQRPYPEQKVVPLDPAYLDAFRRMFRLPEAP